MKNKKARICTLLVAAVLFLTACDVTVSNLTSSRIPENPSGIYTMSMEARIKNAMIDADSMNAKIVIDGETHPMQRGTTSDSIYDFDYRLPEGRDQAAYYFLVDYHFKSSEEKPKVRQVQSERYHFQLSNRYPFTLESNRAPTGTRIPVLGRGFTKYDKIVFGGSAADTQFVSENQLMFVVPAVETGRTYKVELAGGNSGNQFIDNFRVDKSKIRVLPAELVVASGQVQRVIFSIDFDAPAGGLRIDVTTDIPEGVIMDEVVIPQGSRTVNIPVKGGNPSRGSLFIDIPGFESVKVPVTVNP